MVAAQQVIVSKQKLYMKKEINGCYIKSRIYKNLAGYILCELVSDVSSMLVPSTLGTSVWEGPGACLSLLHRWAS